MQKKKPCQDLFLSNMSHDLRTPMNAIIGYTELAQREGVTETERREYLGKNRYFSQYLLALINDVWEMSRIENGKTELELVSTNLVRIIQNVAELFQEQMKSKAIRFTTDTSQIQNAQVICDKNRLNRVLLNLISNAYKFTPGGGNVSVILKQTGTEQHTGIYELRVKDTGIGMQPEFAEHVFEAFEQERTSTISGIQGSGLGMAITKNMITMMQGEIFVETAPNQGTEFIIHIRFPVDRQEQKEMPIPEKKELDFTKNRVLLTEDIPVNRELAKMILKKTSFQVETAENGKIALEKVAASENGYYQAVLMDIQMPVMNGHEATRAIRKLENPVLAQIPVIAMTANAFAEDIAAEKESGMNAHISKPIDVENMLAVLTEVLSEQEDKNS